MPKQDKISTVFWLLVSCLICVESLRIPIGSWHDPGPGLLPLVCGITLGLLSLIAFAEAWRNESTDHREILSSMRWSRLILVIGCLVVYALLLEKLGFLLATFGFLLVILRSVGFHRWIVSIVESGIISIACYLIFNVWLKTQLPNGILGF